MEDHSSFLDALSVAGITPAKLLDMVADGKVHRFDIEGRTTGKKHGWYVLHSDDPDTWGAFGDWQTGLQSSWTLRQKKDVSPAEWAALQARMEAVRKQAEAEAEAMAAEAKAKAASLWAKGKPVAADHPYIRAKGIRPVGGLQLRQMLLIPLHRAGELVSLQVIQPDGSKTFLTGGRTGGAYTMLGQLEAGQPVLICEGWATGCTLHQATGFPVAVAFNAGNLLPVAKALRQQHPAARLILCADDDYQTQGNPGLTKAQEAAKAVSGLLAVPEFGKGRLPKQTDFNDLANTAGIDAVRQQLEAVSSTPAPVEPEVVHRATKLPMIQTSGTVTYRVDENGVYFIGEDREGNELSPRWICSPLFVLAKTRDTKSGNWGRLLEWQDDDGFNHRWAMPLELLEGDSVDMRRELARLGLTIASGKGAGDLLASYIKIWKVEDRAKCVNKLGWHGEVYVLPDKAIGSRDEQVVFQNANAVEPALAVSGTLEQWRANVAALASGNSRMIFGISTAFAGPLAYLANEDSGGFHLRGASSTGKTTALKIGASVWGDPDQYVRLWRATANGLEGMASLHNDNTLFLDELSQCSPREAGEAAYMLGNGQGKTRASKTGAAREVATWRTVFVSTGEETLASLVAKAGIRLNAGQAIRLADIEADAGAGLGAFDTQHTYQSPAALALAMKDGSSRYFGAAGVAWLQWIVSERNRLPDLITDMVDKFIDNALPQKASGQVYRVAKRFALVAVAGELATGAGITGWQPGEAESAVLTCFDSWLECFGGGGKSEERAMLSQVRAFFEAHGASRFEDVLASSEQRVTNRAGFFRTDDKGGKTYYVLPEAFKRDVCVGFDAKAVERLLLEKEWITGESNRATQKPRLPGIGPTRCYVFSGKLWESEE